jgi:uncharacterized protein DUF6249
METETAPPTPASHVHVPHEVRAMHGSFPWYALIPIVSIIGGMSIAATAIVTAHRRKQALMDERRLMIEKGMTPPPLDGQLLSDEWPAGRRSSIECSLRAGIKQAFVGIGLICAFLVVRYGVFSDSVVPRHVTSLLGPAGVIVLLIGVGNLVYYWIASRRVSPHRE